MSLEVVKLACENLTGLEKMKLVQYLVQTSVQAMEKENPKDQVKQSKELVVAEVRERVLKSKPSKVSSLKNFIGSMFQFQGGISDSEIDTIVEGLKKSKILKVNGMKIVYL